ncbi:uncharacterized protein LOC131399887 [Diceros bicornis minor]|uniref:uncharacterized protein LOC131399887 n=1 Tax=Diceros bicornis minor TaxID=77932 RepID=UPI0026EF6DCE|nr:uncharacterized protein LOC131399887 [Diceros bicornis minor]
MGGVLVGEMAFLDVVLAPQWANTPGDGHNQLKYPRGALAWLLLGTATSMGLWLSEILEEIGTHPHTFHTLPGPVHRKARVRASSVVLSETMRIVSKLTHTTNVREPCHTALGSASCCLRDPSRRRRSPAVHRGPLSNVVPSPGLRCCLLHTCLRPGKVRNPPEVRSSGGSGGGSADGEPRTSPRVPNFPVMRRNPGESSQTCSRRGEDAGSPRGRASGRAGGSLPAGCRACCCHLSRRAARRSWWARAPGKGTSPLNGTWLSLQARKARKWRGSTRVHSSSRLLPPSGSRWHHYLFPAAASNDSSRFCRGGAVAVSRSRRLEPSSLAGSPRNRLNFSRSSQSGKTCEGTKEMFFLGICIPLLLCHRFISGGGKGGVSGR